MTTTTANAPLVDELTRHLRRVRRHTLSLVAPLSDADVHGQYVDYLGPLVWDVGHIGNFEEQWLLRHLGGPRVSAGLDRLYDAFEQPRPGRGQLQLLPRDEALVYLREIREEALTLLRRIPLDGEDPLAAGGRVHRMIAQHESQHQETMLQAIGIRRDLRFAPAMPSSRAPVAPDVDDEARVVVPAGPFVLGTDATDGTYDNERPAHRVDVPTFLLDRYPATCRRYAAFIDAGGYEREELWNDRGRAWRGETGHRVPQGWEPDGDGGWCIRRFGFLRPLDPREPVQHISWFEAEAFARWAGGRLPTEIEWEKAASWDPASGHKRRFPWGDTPPSAGLANVGLRRFGPAPVGSFPRGASAYGVEQLAGDVYEWTSSPFQGYPGFTAFPYPEYSEVFLGGDYRVLRGSSWAIAPTMARATYRNWDHPYRRQIMAGVRVAYDA